MLATCGANKGRFYTYEEWLKGKLKANTPWDKIVHEMMTADGKLLDNGATGYLLRDAGMRLDNLSLTLSTFLGANVSCAQCHDHPFADWTQKQFYEMASFFGASETFGAKGAKGSLDRFGSGTCADEQDHGEMTAQQRHRRVLEVAVQVG